MPNAATMPRRIGTTAPARAVADGTKNARMIEITIAPATMCDVFSPATLSTLSAMRRCSPVACIAVASANAAATSATAPDEKPPSAMLSAGPVPKISPGFSGSGDSPTSMAISPMISTELTG